jgi:hypothetical protein
VLFIALIAEKVERPPNIPGPGKSAAAGITGHAFAFGELIHYHHPPNDYCHPTRSFTATGFFHSPVLSHSPYFLKFLLHPGKIYYIFLFLAIFGSKTALARQ